MPIIVVSVDYLKFRLNITGQQGEEEEMIEKFVIEYTKRHKLNLEKDWQQRITYYFEHQ
jgi:hypothetical protein